MSHDDVGAQRRLAIAHDHLARGRVRLVLVGGAPATGKTTLARSVADATGWPVVRSDEVRKELAGIEPTSNAAAPLDQGLYSSEWGERTYIALCNRARALLANGESVVLDASWSDGRWRDLAFRVATETASDLIGLRCDAPLKVSMERAEHRAFGHGDASDAGAAIAAARAARFMPWPEAHSLDTSKPPAEVARAALAVLGAF